MRLLFLALLLLSGGVAAEHHAAQSARTSAGTPAQPLRIAVAANFRNTLEAVGSAWSARSGMPIAISSASTAVLYNQALFGAPFDLLLAADSLRPQRLVESGHALADSRLTYAYGKLVLAYSERLSTDGKAGIPALLSTPGLSLAIANPELAPYGRAAAEVLARHPLADDSRLLTAGNVGQAFQMWFSGGADLALVAASYRPAPCHPVPREWHTPIAQQAVILRNGRDTRLARDFLQFLRSDAARDLIEADGYLTALALGEHE